jgi:hypothetical protein
MKALQNREWLTLPGMFLAVRFLMFPGTVSFGAPSEDIHRWKKNLRPRESRKNESTRTYVSLNKIFPSVYGYGSNVFK